MRRIATILSISLGLVASGAELVGCTANIHDNTLSVPNAKVSIDTSVDVNQLSAGESVPLTLSAENVYLVAPDKTPPPAHQNDAAYFQIFLDDTGGTPLVVTASTMVSVTIPAATKPGHHKLLCQLTQHDGQPTDSVQELDINVKASASVSTSGPDASASASASASGSVSSSTSVRDGG